MSLAWLKKIVVLDPAKSGAAQLLNAAIMAAQLEVDVVPISTLATDEIMAKAPNLIMVVLADPTPPSGIGETGLQPHPMIAAAWELAAVKKCPVHVMVPSDRLNGKAGHFTPLHSASLGLSGITGIWEAGPRLPADLNEPAFLEMLAHLNMYRQMKKVLVYGRVADQLSDFNLQLSGGRWPADDLDDPVDELMARLYFLVTLALSTIGPEKFRLGADPDSARMEKYAEKLLEHMGSLQTDFTIRKLADRLRSLARMWEVYEGFDRSKKYEMPIWARRHGFPEDLPLIRDCPPQRTGDALFHALSSPIFDDELKRDEISLALVDFQRKSKRW